MKVSELLAKTEMQAVPKGKNLFKIGWADGYLIVRFKGRSKLYIYGARIAEEERDKLLRVPYPDKLFTQLRDKHCWQCMKVEGTR